MMEQRPASRPLKGIIADEIRNRIVVGTLNLGERVSDKDLAIELQISRTPVREALLQLQSEGLIVMRPRSGTFVFDLSPDDLREICDLRALFEVGAIRMGVARHPERIVSALTTRVAEAALALEADDFARCEALDTTFHETLIEMSGNKYLINSYRAISDKVCALRSHLPQTRERVANAIGQHRRIIDLIAVGRADAAADELGAHVRNVHALLIAARIQEAA
jgi:DNA-binding GntR family transcriptional regulator